MILHSANFVFEQLQTMRTASNERDVCAVESQICPANPIDYLGVGGWFDQFDEDYFVLILEILNVFGDDYGAVFGPVTFQVSAIAAEGGEEQMMDFVHQH